MAGGLKVLFLIHAVVSAVSGVVLYLVPGTWAAAAGWSPFDPATTRIYGAALLAFAVSSWLAYRAARWADVRIVVLMEIAFTVLGAAGELYNVLVDGAPALAWGPAAIFVSFAIAWVFYYRREVRAARGQGG